MKHCYGVTVTAVEWGRSIRAPITVLCHGALRLSVSVRGMITRRGALNFWSMLSNTVGQQKRLQRGARVRLTLTNGDSDDDYSGCAQAR